MTLKKEYVDIITTVLENELATMKSYEEGNPATDECIKYSTELLEGFRNGITEIDSAAIGYIDTALFNYMPKDKAEYQALVNTMSYMHKNTVDAIYPIETLNDLETAFEWAKEEERGLMLVLLPSIYTKDPKAPCDTLLIHRDNIEASLRIYRSKFTLGLLGRSNEHKIIGYILV